MSPTKSSVFCWKHSSETFPLFGHNLQESAQRCQGWLEAVSQTKFHGEEMKNVHPPPWLANVAHAISTTLPRFHTVAFCSGMVRKSAPCLKLGGGKPPLSRAIGPPPATPQPEPRTGAVPGARHGIGALKSLGPESTPRLNVRA